MLSFAEWKQPNKQSKQTKKPRYMGIVTFKEAFIA